MIDVEALIGPATQVAGQATLRRTVLVVAGRGASNEVNVPTFSQVGTAVG